jgi:hypothetical protein
MRTGFDENRKNQKNRSAFDTKFKIQIWRGGQKSSDFSDLSFGFLVYQSVVDQFLF